MLVRVSQFRALRTQTARQQSLRDAHSHQTTERQYNGQSLWTKIQLQYHHSLSSTAPRTAVYAFECGASDSNKCNVHVKKTNMQLPDELNKWPVIAEAVSPVAVFALTTVQPAQGIEFFTTSIRRDPRTASDHCAAALDVANDVRNSGIEGRDALRAAIAPLAKAEEHEDAERVARVTAIVVKSINGLADALKGRLSGDIVGILAAAAGGAGGGERSRRVHRRLSNAAALLRASPHLAADVVLVQQKADFDLNSRAGAAVSLPAAVAFGFVDDDVHNDLVTTVERTLVATTEWEIRDALFPCATAPIRTPAYKRCLDGVRIVVEACLGGEVASQSAEHATAVALASIARGFGHRQFAAFLAAAASLPAHLPPTGRHGAAWP